MRNHPMHNFIPLLIAQTQPVASEYAVEPSLRIAEVGSNSIGVEVYPDSICFAARPEIASFGDASERTVVFLDGHPCDISLVVECFGNSLCAAWPFGVTWTDHACGRGLDWTRRTKLSKYGDVLLLWQLALDPTS